jgi:hypothetical protein
MLLVATLAVPAFARGRGWGGGYVMTDYWGRGPGYCRQNDGAYGNLSPGQREQLDRSAQKSYERDARDASLGRGYGRGFGPWMRGYGPGTGYNGRMGGFGMGWRR